MEGDTMTFDEAEAIIEKITPPDTFVSLEHVRIYLNGWENRIALYIGTPYRELWEGSLKEVVAKLQDLLADETDLRRREEREARMAL
jgi:hypothetical protein